jgi:hypothetical protein
MRNYEILANNNFRVSTELRSARKQLFSRRGFLSRVDDKIAYYHYILILCHDVKDVIIQVIIQRMSIFLNTGKITIVRHPQLEKLHYDDCGAKPRFLKLRIAYIYDFTGIKRLTK